MSMKRVVFFLCAAIIALVQATVPLWPLPASYSLGSSGVSLASTFTFTAATSNSVLDKAIKRYVKLIGAGSSGVMTNCAITLASADVPAIVGADESYSISVSAAGECSISAKSTWGALRALETFSQLLTRGTDNNGVYIAHAPVQIDDTARYGHRGMLIDTSRHYLPVREIARLIEALPMNKFNVLHWHTVDAESFPLKTPTEPTMVQGAYSPQMVYTMDELTYLHDLAHDLGVDIIFELDVPGHAAAWTKGKPEIMADCFAKYYYNINDFALNPTMDETYTTIQGILSDVVKATGTKRLHLGGDEVVYGCWKNDSSIVSWMNNKGWTDYNQLLGYFVDKTDAIVNNLGAAVTHWEEVFTAGCKVPANTIFQVWTDSSMMGKLTTAQYPVIASPSNYWYLNIATNTWQNMYSYDPTMNLSSAQSSYIVGGEVCLWGEYIDEINIEQNIYPRASAVGERLWSPKTVTDATDALNRLMIQRCRMVNRGVRASPVQPADYCTENFV